jgi:putative ABC transport system permease protein
MRKTFIKKGIREIWQHKFKYFSLILVLALGVSMYASLYDMLDSRKISFDAIYDESKFMDVQIKFDYGQTGNKTIVKQVMESPEISGQVSEVEYRLTYDVFLNHSTGDGVKTTKGIIMGHEAFGPDGELREYTVNKPLFYVGDPDEFSSPDSRECYIERKFSRSNDLSGGDKLTVINGPIQLELDILEQVNIPEYFMVVVEGSFMPMEKTLGVLVVPMETAQEIYLGGASNETLVNDIVIKINEPEDLETFREQITREFEGAGIPVKTIGKEENPARNFLKSDLESDEGLMAIFPIIIFIVAGFGLIMALRRMIQTHKSQIGVFKALGVPDRFVLIYFATIGIMIAVLGTVLGWIIAIPLNSAFEGLARDLLDTAIYEYNTSLSNFLVAGAISVIMCLACTIIPAWWALRIKPIDAIQQREGLSKKNVGRLASKVGHQSKMPVPVKLTMRNLFRRPGRTTTTVIGVALALALFLSFIMLLDSIVVVLDTSQTTRWDYEVGMQGFTPTNITDDWDDNFQDIEEITHGILLPTQLYKGSRSKEAIVYALEDVNAAYKMKYEGGGLKNGQIVISFYHADKLGLEVGDTVQMEVPRLDMAAGYSMIKTDLTVSGIHSNHIGYYAFMDLSTFHSVTNLTGMANIVYINMEGGEKSQDLENTIITTPGISSISHRSESENMMGPYLDLIVGAVVMIGLLSVALTAAIVYNLFMINAEEKKRDYATMKTLGTSLKRLGYLIFLEAAFITVLGIALGTIGGYFMAIGMIMGAPELEILNFEIVFSWWGFISGSLIIGLVVACVSLLTIRYIHRIHIANVIRERSTG